MTHKLWELWFKLKLPQLSSYPLQTRVELIQALNGMPSIVSPLLSNKTNLFGQNIVLISQTSFPTPIFQYFQLTVFCLKTSSLRIADIIKCWIRNQRAKRRQQPRTVLDICISSMKYILCITLFQTEFSPLKKWILST